MVLSLSELAKKFIKVKLFVLNGSELLILSIMARNIEFVLEEKIEKAMGVFWNKGYAGASLADLTEAMELNKSSLYNSFGDKHTLFIKCLKNYGELTKQDYVTAVSRGKTAIDKLGNIIDMIVRLSIERPNSCLGVKTSFELASEDEEVHALIKAGQGQIINIIQSLIEEAQAEGEIKTDRDAYVMAHFVFNSFAGLRQSYIISNHVGLLKKMANELKTFLII
jgi:Transcriptional regulator